MFNVAHRRDLTGAGHACVYREARSLGFALIDALYSARARL